MRKNKRYIVPALVLLFSMLLPAMASATTLSQAGLRLGRLATSAGSGGAGDSNDLLVTFKLRTNPTTVAKITITFPSSFTLTNGTPTPAVTGFPNTPASITAPPGTLTAAVSNTTHTIIVSGLTSLSLNATTLYGFIIPAGSITNPSSAGQYSPTVESDTSGSTTVDLTTTPVYITSGAGSDQVTVNASVSPNFSFSLSGNTDTVPTVDPTAPQTSTGINMTISTNSPLGYTAYVKSKNGGLTSATAGSTIATGSFNGTPDALTPAGSVTDYTFVPTSGTLCTTSCSSSVAYDGEYAGLTAGGSGTTGGAFNGTSFSSFVSRAGYTGGDTILLQERVAVKSTVPYANDYTDTLTIVAAGNY